MKDYYQILELSPNASITEVKSAFRRLSFKFHPDLNNEEDAEDNFKNVNEAYQILSDAFLRQTYDVKIKQSKFIQTHNHSSSNDYRSSRQHKKTNYTYRNVIYVFLFFITAFIIFLVTPSISSVNTINEYKSNLSKKAKEYYANSPEKNKHIEIIIRRTNSLVDMFRNMPK